MTIRLTIIFLYFYLTNASLNNRLDCDLEVDFKSDQKSCEERGCVWDSQKTTKDIPICYLDVNKVGYKRVTDVKNTNDGLEVELQIKDSAKDLLKHSKYVTNLKFEVTYLTNRIVRLKVLDTNHTRYEVPFQKNFPLLQKHIDKTSDDERKYSVDISEDINDFTFSVIRRNSKTKLFDTSIGGLIFSDQLLQIATSLPTRNVYGLGETDHRSLRHDTSTYNTWPIFNQDHYTGEQDKMNYYGAHPFYQVLESDGKSHGVLLLNSNAMDYTLLPEPGIKFRTVGGVLDLFIMVGDNPGHVIELYTSLIGRPFMPPFWALGFQLSKYGFENTNEVRKIIDRTRKAQIPLDVIYMDSGYKMAFRDFSLDQKRYGDLPKLINETNELGIRWNLIIDPAIEAYDYPSGKVYPAFTDGYKNEVFVKWDESVPKEKRFNPPNAPSDKDVIYGKVWPEGPVAYPDFFKNKTYDWFKRSLTHLHNDFGMKFNALWIDMNEPSNLIDNFDFESNTHRENYSCPENKFDYPPVKIMPNYVNGVHNLSHHTLCMMTRQGEHDQYLHYDVHSLYGLSQQIHTERAVHEITGKRGFSLSRSTYVSSGRYGAHWLGDNVSEWPHMKLSIIGTLEMNLFGIPLVGPDICGFIGNTTADLCKRWHSLGAFYPFSRNHNGATLDQDPAVWAEVGRPDVTDAARNSLRVRYSLLPYIYTLFYRAHTLGQTVARPVFHEFPEDNNTHAIDEQLMLGSSLLVSPFLYQNQTQVNAYLPNDVWYDYIDNMTKVQKTGYVVLPDNEEGIPPIHMRGGSILPVSSEEDHDNSDSVRQTPINLWVLPGTDKTASGDLFWDDGESIDTIENGRYNYFTFNLHNNGSLDINVVKSYHSGNLTIKTVVIHGFNEEVITPTLDEQLIVVNKINNKTEIEINLDLTSKTSGHKFTLNLR